MLSRVLLGSTGGFIGEEGLEGKVRKAPQWYCAADYSAPWCPPTIREQMKQARENDDDFKKKSEQCSRNKLTNESQKVHHRQESILAEEVKLKLEKKLKRRPTIAEVYLDGHADEKGQFVNSKAKEVWDEFEKKMAANLESDKETQKTEDELFFEAVGRWNDKGRIFGLGAAAHLYYEKPTVQKRNGKKPRGDYIKSLEAKVVELAAKNEEQNIELVQTKEGLVETQTKLVETEKVLGETRKTLSETTENFMSFKQRVKKCMQAHPPPP